MLAIAVDFSTEQRAEFLEKLAAKLGISIKAQIIPNFMAIRDALAGIKDVDTNLGNFSFDANGDAVYEPVLLIVKNGSLELF